MSKPPNASSPSGIRIWKWSAYAFVGLLSLSLLAVAPFAVGRMTGSAPGICATCHVMEPYVSSYLTGNHMDGVHRLAHVGCRDCHPNYSAWDELTSAWRYVRGAYEQPLARRTFDQAICLRCHVSMAYHAARTDFLVRNPHLSHWPDLACGDCHLAHEPQIDYCGYCHDNGGQRMTGDPIQPRADNPWARPARPAKPADAIPAP